MVSTKEVIDRVSRLNNIIILKLRESNLRKDNQTIRNILNKISINLDTVNGMRLGDNASQRKPRPLLVKFNNREDAYKFYKNRDQYLKNCIITFDRTKYQRTNINKLRIDMKRHNERHPDNKKYIKFIDGEPTLIDLPLQDPQQKFDDNSDNGMNHLNGIDVISQKCTSSSSADNSIIIEEPKEVNQDVNENDYVEPCNNNTNKNKNTNKPVVKSVQRVTSLQIGGPSRRGRKPKGYSLSQPNVENEFDNSNSDRMQLRKNFKTPLCNIKPKNLQVRKRRKST